MKATERGRYVLSSGREVNANNGIIGLNPETLSISEGYDGRIDAADADPDPDVILPEERWTTAERVELADFMIEHWQRYRAAALAGAVDRRAVEQLGKDFT